MKSLYYKTKIYFYECMINFTLKNVGECNLKMYRLKMFLIALFGIYESVNQKKQSYTTFVFHFFLNPFLFCYYKLFKTNVRG